MKAFFLVAFLFLCSGCSKTPEPVVQVKPPQPPPPPRASKADYWLSHPGVVLLSAKYNVGVDTIMAIANDFNALYNRTEPLSVKDAKDPASYISPIYSGLKGEGPSPSTSHDFFVEQSKKYGLEKKEIAEIIIGVNARAKMFTPRKDFDY